MAHSLNKTKIKKKLKKQVKTDQLIHKMTGKKGKIETKKEKI